MRRCASSYLSAATCGFAGGADEKRTAGPSSLGHFTRARAPWWDVSDSKCTRDVLMSGRENRRLEVAWLYMQLHMDRAGSKARVAPALRFN